MSAPHDAMEPRRQNKLLYGVPERWYGILKLIGRVRSMCVADAATGSPCV